jgi:hypothetical protein
VEFQSDSLTTAYASALVFPIPYYRRLAQVRVVDVGDSDALMVIMHTVGLSA